MLSRNPLSLRPSKITVHTVTMQAVISSIVDIQTTVLHMYIRVHTYVCKYTEHACISYRLFYIQHYTYTLNTY